ncbi:MAG: DUF2752 domain-containing protein [Planctomycetaceae bacterium]|nr:DUF2752 domain-containing protein [Planctomycetaceae bacterium]
MNNAVLIADCADDARSVRRTPAGAHEKYPAPGEPRRLAVAGLSLLGVTMLAVLWWFDPAKMGLPLCSFRVLTGLNCPGCGATRATHEMLHGHWLAAWRLNALWVLSWPVALYLVASELRILAGRRPLPGDLPRQPWFWISVTLAAVLFFFVRNLPCVGM